ncbi:MAG: hypothetical protein UHU19_09405 [Lachnospiraceae bacterium]|nr:hypothetical protein [Lachnospiraceae bacterium]
MSFKGNTASLCFNRIGQDRYDISNMAHIVGGLIGGVTGYILNKKAKYGY